MGLRQSAPGDRGERKHVHWPHVTTARGAKWTAYTAGPIHWFRCHETKRTKPCLSAISDGELTCPACAALIPVRVMGYIPVWREADARPCQALLYDDARADLDRLKLHTRVMVGRGMGKTDSVYVIALSDQRPVWEPRDPERLKPADLTRSLLRMWAIPELIGWYTQTEGVSIPEPKPQTAKSDNALSLTEKIKEGERGTVGDWVDVALGNVQERNKRFAEAVKKGEAAARNGKPKPAQEG